MSAMSELIIAICEPMAYVASEWCGTDWDDEYRAYAEWYCSGADADEFAEEADRCIVCAVEMGLEDDRMLDLKRAVLVGAELIRGDDPDALEVAMRAELEA